MNLAQALRLLPLIPQVVTDADPVTSRKEWARGFTMYNWKVQSTTYANFMAYFEPLNAEDTERLRSEAHPPSHPTVVTTEGDVVSHLDEDIILLLKQAFTSFPYVSFPSQHGPAQAAHADRPIEDIVVFYALSVRGFAKQLPEPCVVWHLSLLERRTYLIYWANSRGSSEHNSSTSKAFFFSMTSRSFSHALRAFKPCQGSRPHTKYTIMYPRDSKSSFWDCTGVVVSVRIPRIDNHTHLVPSAF